MLKSVTAAVWPTCLAVATWAPVGMYYYNSLVGWAFLRMPPKYTNDNCVQFGITARRVCSAHTDPSIRITAKIPLASGFKSQGVERRMMEIIKHPVVGKGMWKFMYGDRLKYELSEFH